MLERLDERLALLDTLPVQVHWGMKDFVFDGDFLARLEQRLPHAEVHRFPDAGHYVLEDVARPDRRTGRRLPAVPSAEPA